VRNRFFAFTLVAWIGGALIGSPAFSREEVTPTWQTGLSFSYLTGDYGEDEDTDIRYTALNVKRYYEIGDVTLTVPYIDISADGATFVGGQVEPLAGAGSGEGLGDIILKGRYYAVQQDGPLPFIDLVGSIKFPTADEDEGLGTGEADFTWMVEVARRLEDKNWIALGEIGYTFVGEPSGFDADNRWLYSIGMAYEIDPDITLSGYIDGRTAIFPGNDDPLSILLISELKLSTDLRFDTMLEFGLNDGAPDFGITLGIRKRF
jgi:hypothetical protein